MDQLKGKREEVTTTKKTRYEELYPHPARGFDSSQARARVEANPEVMPPKPMSSKGSEWKNREVMGMRPLPLAMFLGAGFLLPAFLKFGAAKRRKEEKRMKSYLGAKAHQSAKKRGKAAKKMWKMEQAAKAMEQPRFLLIASRPWGKRGKRARVFLARRMAEA